MSRPTRPPMPDTHPGETSFTCDWGRCNHETLYWRWSFLPGTEWLPVCVKHSLKADRVCQTWGPLGDSDGGEHQ